MSDPAIIPFQGRGTTLHGSTAPTGNRTYTREDGDFCVTDGETTICISPASEPVPVEGGESQKAVNTIK